MAEQEYNNVEEAIEELKQDAQFILLWAALGTTVGIDVFVTRIQSEIARLRSANIGNREIVRILRDDLANRGRIFGEFSNSIKRGVVSGIMQGARAGQDEIYGNRMKMRWVSVGSPKICVDCESRVGQIASWDEWESLGLPATGFSICKEFCYCQLIPEGIEIDDRVIVR